MRLVVLTVLAAALMWLGSGCAVNPVTGDSDLVLLSESQEIALGARYHEQIRSRYGEYDDKRLQALVSRVGQRLARVSHRPGLAYRFTLLDSPEVNAFALPGGYVYVTRGLLAYLNSEAELAAVLGHEIGHVTARHSVRQHRTSTLTGLFGAILGAQVGAGGQELISLAGTALVRGYGREHELESDRLGAQYLARAGYDPGAMLRVIQVLKDQEQHEMQRARAEGREPRVYHGLFATHPDNDRRLQGVVAAAGVPGKSPSVQDQDVRFVKALDGLVFGDSAAAGIVRNNRFYHGPLGVMLTLPEGWRTINTPRKLVLEAAGQDALIVLESIPHQPGKRLAEVMREQLKGEAPRHVFTIDEPDREGYGATVTLNTPFGLRESRVVVMRIGDRTFRLAAAVDETPWPPGHARAIHATLRGLHPLTPEHRAQARALRLTVIRASADTRIAQLAERARDLPAIAAHLRLLNRLYPDGEPRPGQWLKAIE